MKFTLEKFESWMGVELKLTPSTRRNYRNFARAFLRDERFGAALVSDPGQFVALAAEYDDSLASSSRPLFRSAIRTFARYLQAHLGSNITFRFTRQREWRLAESAPHARYPLGRLLRDLEAQHVPFNRLEFIHWRDVRRSGNRGELNDRMRGDRYLALIETIQALSLWAGGGVRADPDQPIVPTAPKSFAPMATRRLLRLARGA